MTRGMSSADPTSQTRKEDGPIGEEIEIAVKCRSEVME